MRRLKPLGLELLGFGTPERASCGRQSARHGDATTDATRTVRPHSAASALGDGGRLTPHVDTTP
eukprot:2864004-Prymnesium_polylepis.1